MVRGATTPRPVLSGVFVNQILGGELTMYVVVESAVWMFSAAAYIGFVVYLVAHRSSRRFPKKLPNIQYRPSKRSMFMLVAHSCPRKYH